MKILLFSEKLKRALTIKDAFDRFASGQASQEDKALVHSQNFRWKTVARRNSYLSPVAKKRLEDRRKALLRLISLAEKNKNMYRIATLYAEWYNL